MPVEQKETKTIQTNPQVLWWCVVCLFVFYNPVLFEEMIGAQLG